MRTRVFQSALCAVAALLLITSSVQAQPANPLRDEFLRGAASSYAVLPDIARCQAGVLKDAEKQQALDVINDIRRLHGLGAVTYDTSADAEVMQASLMIAANDQLSHTPPPSWKCFSQDGAAGAGTSVIYGGLSSPNLSYYTPEKYIIGWLCDTRNVVSNSIGHRRWLLDPFLKQISFGAVQGQAGQAARNSNAPMSGGAAMKVVYSNETRATAKYPIIAYPDGDYPARYYADGALLSFGLVIDYTDKFANDKVDYSKAKIVMRKRDGTVVPVSDIAYFTDFSGLPNSLQFKPQALEHNTYYDVNVTGVKVNGEIYTFSYWFRVVG